MKAMTSHSTPNGNNHCLFVSFGAFIVEVDHVPAETTLGFVKLIQQRLLDVVAFVEFDVTLPP